MKKYLIAILFLTSCGQQEQPLIETSEADSVIAMSRKNTDSAVIIIKRAEKRTEEQVFKVVEKVAEMNEKVSEMKLQVKAMDALMKEKPKTVTVTVRDTIYITEKKNFWGKTKKSVDSSSSTNIDSTEN